MKRRMAVVWISLAMMLSLIVIVVDLSPPTKAAIITVDDSGGADYNKIQDAINASNPGDTIFVYNGTYTENVVVNKTITLIGEDRETTIIDGGYIDNTVHITAHWVNFTGFTVIRGGMNPMENAGLRVDSDNNSIFNNTMTFNEGHAMLLNDSHDNYVHNNSISGNEQGLWIQYSSRSNFFNNTISNNDQGMSISSSAFNTFINNTVIDNWHGISMTSSNNNSFFGNNISGNQYGMEMNGCDDAAFTGNTFISNDHGGLKANICDKITVTHNEFVSNGDYGLLMESVLDFDVNNNTFEDSGIFVSGGKLGYWNTHTIAPTNTINGKPLYYWKDRNGGTIPAGAGQVILANCSNIEVRDQELTDGVAAVELGFSTQNNVTGNDLSFNDYGVYSVHSDLNNISGNQVVSNDDYGIYLLYSSHNNLTDNNLSWIGETGVYTQYSSNNTIMNNDVSYSGSALLIIDSTNTTVVNNRGFDGSQGIRLVRSSNNVITKNNMSSMTNRGISLYADCKWNTIDNNTLLDNYYGISMESSPGYRCNNNSIANNIITGNGGHGISIYDCDSLTIDGNQISSSWSCGVSLMGVLNSYVANNTISFSGNYGLMLQVSQYINMTNNEFIDDGVFISGTEVSHFNTHEIPENNLVNGNPVRYVKDGSNITIDSQPTGQVIIANCQDINLENLVISNTDCGIEEAFSTRITIYKNNVSHNDKYGIYLYESSYSNILKSDIISSGEEGVSLRQSPDCGILWNNISFNNWYNLLIDFSPNCNATGNNISNGNDQGIFIQASSDSVFQDNLVYGNRWGLQANGLSGLRLIGNDFFNNSEVGMHIQNSAGTKIIDSRIYNNGEEGISLLSSTSANITGNSFILNDGYGLYLSGSWGCEVASNIFSKDGMFIYGSKMSDYNSHTIPDNNLVNGKPLYYHRDANGIALDGIPVGQLIIANCSDVDIKNIEIIDTDVGIEAVYSTALNTSNNNISSNYVDGLYLYQISDSNLTANTISYNERMGTYLQSSSNLNIANNTFEGDGIFILGDQWAHYDSNTIPVNNEANGRPIYYLVNVSGMDFDGGPVGQLILINCTNINATNLLLDDASVGVEAVLSRNINIANSRISNNYYGFFQVGWDCKVISNNISSNRYGVYLDYGYDAVISSNNITHNEYGVYNDAYDTRVYHNNFIDNKIQARNEWEEYYWDDGYPSGGNYWSDHSPTCPDLYSGPDTPQTSGSPDGICDEYYYVGSDAYDRYPLKYPWGIPSPDTIPPATITDLEALDPTTDSLTLTWTAPGDDGDSGTAAGYVVKYSSSGPINDLNWDSASTYGQSWTPLAANNTETYVISGLALHTTYWFAIRAYDEMGNYGGISNSASGTTLHTDMTSPATITDLEASNPTNASIALTWTAVADNGSDPASGNASYYDIRYMISTKISNDNWDSATQVGGGLIPGIPGTLESFVVTNLLPGTTYCFAIKVGDDVPHWSPISNSPNATTLGNDTAQPNISEITVIPSTQKIGGAVNISALVVDNVAISAVNIEVKDPLSTVLGNFTMLKIGDIYYHRAIFSGSLGMYTFTIWALDTSNNSAFAMGSFEMVDISIPDISNVQALPSIQELDGAVNITVSVTDNVDVEAVWLQILSPDGTELENITMNRVGLTANYWYNRTYSTIGEFGYYVWAKDSSNNWALTEGDFVIQDTILPVPKAGVNIDILQGDTVTFDGSGSSDNDEITNYTWDFDYDGETIILYGMNPSFQFVIIGNYTIALTVTDHSGNSANDSIWINVIGVDSDEDGLTDWDEENIYGTKTDDPDTDGDGVNDGDEIERGTDPLVPDKEKEPEKSLVDNYWWILLIIVVIIVSLLLFILSKRKEEEKVEEGLSEPEITGGDKEPTPEVPASPETTEEDAEPAAETQPVKREPPRPPRAPRSRT